MKIKIHSYNAVASWRWNIKPEDKDAASKRTAHGAGAEEGDEEEEEEDLCGICRVAFEGTCPNCKVPGDDCPLSTLLLRGYNVTNYWAEY